MSSGYTRFSRVSSANVQRSSFDLSHSHKTTFNGSQGELIPVCLMEVVPGDTFKADMTGFVRLATPLKPVMDNLHIDCHWFFVPHRLSWDRQDVDLQGSFAEMMGEGYDPKNPVHYTVPKTSATTGQTSRGMFTGSFFDYIGVPVHFDGGDDTLGELKFSALPLQGYQKIWRDWYADQNLQIGDPQLYELSDDQGRKTKLLPRCKRHDYFTGCLPWPQKGEPVSVPIGGDGSLVATGSPTFTIDGKNGGQSLVAEGTLDPINNVGTDGVGGGVLAWDDPALEINLSSVSAVSINDFRTAIAFQQLLERDARGGTRYNEIIQSHFSVVNPDARLQRAEFLGGGSSRVNIRQVEQTNSNDDTGDGLGNLGAYGTAVMSGNRFTKSFTEYGYIFCLVNVRADLSYQQGMPRHLLRDSKYDFYWPTLQFIGDQIVWDLEIFTRTTDGFPGYADVVAKENGYVDPFELWQEKNAEGEGVFGYQERWAELRYHPNMITGQFRSTDDETLDIWHLAEEFENQPTLSSEFIESNPPLKRVLSVTDGPEFIGDFYFKVRATRPMSMYGDPGMYRI